MHKFTIYPDGQGFSLHLVYSRADNSVADEKKAYFHFSRTTVLLYAHKHFAIWLQEQFSNYVNQAETLFQTSNNGFYCTNSKLASMGRIKDFHRISSTEGVSGLTLQILNLEQDMRNVLPSSKQEMYNSAHSLLEDIIEHARRFRKIHLKKT
jgi:hypothetical protein